jgi:hypothetical protein
MKRTHDVKKLCYMHIYKYIYSRRWVHMNTRSYDPQLQAIRNVTFNQTQVYGLGIHASNNPPTHPF